MKLEEIKKIVENKGETLTKDLKKAELKKGYMVSLEGTESQVQGNNYNAIIEAVKEKQEIIQDKDNLYIGLWLDNDIMYIDISINIQDKADALEFAKYNRQLAIYDLVNNDSIYLRDYNFIKYYSLYEVVRDSSNHIIDYRLEEQRENLQLFKSIKASAKTLLNATYKSIDEIKDDSRLIDGKYLVIRDFEVVL